MLKINYRIYVRLRDINQLLKCEGLLHKLCRWKKLKPVNKLVNTLVKCGQGSAFVFPFSVKVMFF